MGLQGLKQAVANEVRKQRRHCIWTYHDMEILLLQIVNEANTGGIASSADGGGAAAGQRGFAGMLWDSLSVHQQQATAAEGEHARRGGTRSVEEEVSGLLLPGC